MSTSAGPSSVTWHRMNRSKEHGVVVDYGMHDRAQVIASGKFDALLRIEVDPATMQVISATSELPTSAPAP